MHLISRILNRLQMLLFTHIRLAKAFSNYDQRVQCVQARLQAISILGKTNHVNMNIP